MYRFIVRLVRSYSVVVVLLTPAPECTIFVCWKTIVNRATHEHSSQNDLEGNETDNNP